MFINNNMINIYTLRRGISNLNLLEEMNYNSAISACEKGSDGLELYVRLDCSSGANDSSELTKPALDSIPGALVQVVSGSLHYLFSER